jgi:phosphatidylglycerol:prolipoprotein diacylglycerol transferase
MSYIPFPDISPEIFSLQLGGVTLALRWYALAYVVGLLIAWKMIEAALARPALWPAAPPMPPEAAERLLTWLILGVLLGGRIGYVLFYQPGRFIADPLAILRVWEGGMSFHGGFLGIVVVGWIFARAQCVAYRTMADLMALATPPGLLLGRIANFINAELWGRPTDLPWGVAFPGAAAQDCPSIVGVCARHPSQLYEAALEGALLGVVLVWLVWRARALARPGLVAGVFLAGYGGARMLVETVREADAQFVTPDNPLGHVLRLGEAGLSMGQLLSLPMVLVGLWLVASARRTPMVATP